MRAALRSFHHENGMDMAHEFNGACDCDSCRESRKILRVRKEEKKPVDKKPEEKILLPGVNLAPSQRVAGALRDRYLEHLRTSYEQERLDLPELSARMDAAMKAVTEADLKTLICDLPVLPVLYPAVPYKVPVKSQKEAEVEDATVSMAFGTSAVSVFVLAVLS